MLSYSYNPIGTLVQQTDATGRGTSYTYDGIDRPLTKSDVVNGTPSLAATYNYDEAGASYGQRRRTSASTADGQVTTTFNYDPRGRLGQENATIQGVSGTQSLSWVYDEQDRPLQVTYPDGDVVTYQYGDHGKLVQLTSSRFGILIRSVSYNPLLRPTQVSWAPNGTTNFQYVGIDVSGSPYGALHRSSNSFETWTYGYDPVGNLTSLTETILGSGTAAYDEQDRLTACTWTGSESFGYPPIDNLTTLDGTSISYGSPPGTPAHGPLTVGGVGYTYDQGYPTGDGVRSYTHDAERRLTSVSQGGQTLLSFVYDFDNKRLKRTANGVTTVYVGERYEIDLATGQTMAYYPWEGTPLPMRQGNNLYLLHTDNLGSVTRATDGNGANVATARYSAYGALLTGKSSGTLPTDRGFTGQIRDGSASGWELYFFRSRYYNAATGRFLEPDTIVPDPKNPQALNRYAYTLDNPLKLVDPSGHDPKDWFNQQWVKEFRTAHNGADPQANDYAYRFVTMAQASGTPVPELFAIPPGTDIGKNLQYGRQMSKFAAMSGQGDQGNSIFSFFNFVGLVRPNGRWDYKHRFGDAYFGFGNFNFGATGAAFGYSEALLERGAGLAQYPATWLANAEIWKLRTFNHDFRYNYQHTGPGNPLGGPTYGDVPDDNAMIKIGYDFYQAYVAAPPPSSVPQ